MMPISIHVHGTCLDSELNSLDLLPERRMKKSEVYFSGGGEVLNFLHLKSVNESSRIIAFNFVIIKKTPLFIIKQTRCNFNIAENFSNGNYSFFFQSCLHE